MSAKAFGVWVKKQADLRGWGVPELSKRSGLPRNTLYKILADGREPRAGTRMALERCFGLEYK